jgi:hypothetical protein
MIEAVEEVVFGVILIAFIVILGLLAVDIWPLWIPEVMLVYAFTIHIGLT